MKKIFVFTLMAMFTLATQAQIVSSRSSRVTTTKTYVENKNWSYIYIQYNPGVFSPKEGDSKSFNGLSLGYNKNFSISNSIPLYLETGLGVQWSFYSETIKGASFNGRTVVAKNIDQKFNMLSIKIPVSVGYAFDIPNAPVTIIPNVGFDLRFNPLAQMKIDGHTINLLSKNDMGSSDATWNVFQLGGHIGVNARFWEKLLVGVGYQMDFTEIAKKAHVYQGNITVGYCF